MISSRVASWTLPRDFYTNPEILKIDLQRAFRPAWLYVGHTSRIPKAGDYFLYEVAGDSIIVIRAHDGTIHGLRNVCRHRGSRVCTLSSGNAQKLVCPYHQWMYDLDGKLLKARLMPEDFKRSEFGLRAVPLEMLCGLIFVCLDEGHAPAFAEFANRIGPQLRPQNLDAAHVAHKLEYVVQANWKLVLENSRECYHCGTGHPQYCRAVGFAAGIDSLRAAQEDASLTGIRVSELMTQGIEARPIDFSETGWFHARRFFLRDQFTTESLDGMGVAPQLAALPGSKLGVLAVVTYPNLLLEACTDYAMAMRFTPHTETRTQVSMEWLVAPDAIEGSDYQIARLEEFWKLTAEQDWRLCEENQNGVNTEGYLSGPYAPEERGVEQFVEWYLEQLRK